MERMRANDAYMRVNGATMRDRVIAMASRDFDRQVIDNPGYAEDALRNGVRQRFLITRSDVTYKCNIVAYPGEDLCPGDIIEYHGDHWIVHQTRVTNAVQISGVAWLCNHKFRFQTFSSEIHERWGVLDSGVYSTSRTSDSTIMSLDMQFRIYLPGDDVTEKIHEDQRLATDKWVDKNGDPILLVYAVTGRDRVSKSYGDGGHLLMLNARASAFNAETDNFEEMICDYISPETEPVSEQAPEQYYEITGRNYVRIGSSRVYECMLHSNSVNETNVPDRVLWTTDAPEGVNMEPDGNRVTLSVLEDKALLGSRILLQATDPDDEYGSCSYEIEVTL